MISPWVEKRVLQCVIALACLVPLSAGLSGAVQGVALLDGSSAVTLDSHFRYLSGLLLGIGLCFLSVIPHIEHKTARMRLLTLIVFTGGISRLLGFLLMGLPHRAMLAAAGMEVIVTPLLCVWQHHVSTRMKASRT